MERFRGGDGWVRGGGGNIVPTNVAEHMIVCADGLVKWRGVIYTGVLRVRDAAGLNLVEYGSKEISIKVDHMNDVFYYRQTGISKMADELATPSN